jgi:hypothetical protein
MENEFIEPQPKSYGYIIAICICILVIVLYYWVSPYVYNLVSFVQSLQSTLDILSSFSSESTNDSESITESKSESKSESNTGSNTESKSKVAKLSTPKQTTVPKPDESSSSIQGTGFCYIGEWKGVRSCVKVDKKTPCKTQVYSTEELCVNPTLRP